MSKRKPVSEIQRNAALAAAEFLLRNRADFLPLYAVPCGFANPGEGDLREEALDLGAAGPADRPTEHWSLPGPGGLADRLIKEITGQTALEHEERRVAASREQGFDGTHDPSEWEVELLRPGVWLVIESSYDPSHPGRGCSEYYSLWFASAQEADRFVAAEGGKRFAYGTMPQTRSLDMWVHQQVFTWPTSRLFRPSIFYKNKSESANASSSNTCRIRQRSGEAAKWRWFCVFLRADALF